MSLDRTYWKDIEEKEKGVEADPSAHDEFPETQETQDFLASQGENESVTGRRDFLKFLGFSLSAATVAACETPVNKAIPYVNKPEEVTPGVPNWYASTYYDGNDFASVLVKTREGRPIFLKGNDYFGLNQGGVNARVNSSLLSLYDSQRLQNPLKNGEETDWDTVDQEIPAKLKEIAEAGGTIRILSQTVISPSTKAAIGKLREAYGKSSDQKEGEKDEGSGEDTNNTRQGGDLQHIVYDPVSFSAIREANKRSFGEWVFPSYDLSKAKVITSIAADFLSDWPMSTGFTKDYKNGRDPDKSWMSRHFQFESHLSVTGSNADLRYPIKPSEEGLVAAAIHDHIAKKAGKPSSGVDTKGLEKRTAKVAEELWENRGESLVLAGSNIPSVQLLVNAINDILGNYGNTIDLNDPVFFKQGDEEQVKNLVEEMKNGQIDALLIYGANPAYSLPNAESFKKGIEGVELTVSMAPYQDETASLCQYICPDHHFLESWNDHQPKKGHYAVVQPAIRNLFNTRQAQQSFLNWAGEEIDYHDFIQENWQASVHDPEQADASFDRFWQNAVHNGVYEMKKPASDNKEEPESLTRAKIREAGGMVEQIAGSAGKTELVLYQKTGIGDGQHANNPWLQELPDPISRVTWDNYITMSPKDMEGHYNTSIGQEWPADMVRVKVGDRSLKLPVYPQPGQKRGTIGIALGYGRGANGEQVGLAAFQTKEYGSLKRDADGNPVPVGKNAYPLASFQEGKMDYRSYDVSLEKTGETYLMATTQRHHTIMGRDSILRETTHNTYKNGDPETYNPPHTHTLHEDGKAVEKDVKEISLWEEHPVYGTGHRWGMSIDLNTCIGCGACVTACTAENNVPVVGKDEVRRSREMHWIRIDRYYSSIVEDQLESEQAEQPTHEEMDTPEENPDVTFQPMMCQHCNHAPCETVCPVSATTHSNEGFNQMAYNRCIGTRYCANNCPYKVRRFNWFNYQDYEKFENVNPAQDQVGRMVLNPDVTVRSRGVMEKCSMCAQRVQKGKLEAKKAGKKVEDGAIQTACAEACPTNAITFGDKNDEESKARREEKSNRGYHALEEIGTKPNINYMVKVRNRKQEETKG